MQCRLLRYLGLDWRAARASGAVYLVLKKKRRAPAHLMRPVTGFVALERRPGHKSYLTLAAGSGQQRVLLTHSRRRAASDGIN